MKLLGPVVKRDEVRAGFISVAEHCEDFGSKALPRIKGSYTLTLTLYEIGNALWKEATLLKRVALRESTYILNTVMQLLKFIHVV